MQPVPGLNVAASACVYSTMRGKKGIISGGLVKVKEPEPVAPDRHKVSELQSTKPVKAVSKEEEHSVGQKAESMALFVDAVKMMPVDTYVETEGELAAKELHSWYESYKGNMLDHERELTDIYEKRIKKIQNHLAFSGKHYTKNKYFLVLSMDYWKLKSEILLKKGDESGADRMLGMAELFCCYLDEVKSEFIDQRWVDYSKDVTRWLKKSRLKITKQKERLRKKSREPEKKELSLSTQNLVL